jgi:sulfur-carrier protein adenylyltransferase/sulfurtransferase
VSSQFTQDEVFRYSRHLMIPEVGLEGQQKLKASSVLIIGAGGLGSPVALYLAAAGIGRIGLVDDDVVDASNLQRQILHDSLQIGHLKVESGRSRLLALNPYIQVDAICDCFNEKTAAGIADGYDILVDCSDNFATRYLVNDLCVLTHRPDVYGAIYRFEGQVSVFDARRGPCYRCIFPEPPPPELSPSCAEAGVFGVLPGVIGSLQAAEVIKLALGIGEPLFGRLMIYDALDGAFQNLKMTKQKTCRVCGKEPSITTLTESGHFCGDSEILSLTDSEKISAVILAGQLKDSNPPILLDVRTPVEQQVSKIEGAISIPLEQLSDRLDELDKNHDIVVFCRTGTRSARALHILTKSGFIHVRNLIGGINAWAENVDKGLFQY